MVSLFPEEEPWGRWGKGAEGRWERYLYQGKGDKGVWEGGVFLWPESGEVFVAQLPSSVGGSVGVGFGEDGSLFHL